jgi:cytoskeletal protein RodZ
MAGKATPGGVGAKLLAAREQRGVPLRDIADATRIPVRVLEAIERNDVASLPSGIFVRSFIRAFATHVALDPEKTVREFMAQFPDEAVAAGYPARWRPAAQTGVNEPRRMRPLWLLAGLGVPIAAALSYVLLMSDGPLPPPEPVVTAASADGVAAGTLPTAPGTVAAAVQTSGNDAPAQDVTRPTAAVRNDQTAGNLVVELTATEGCWVSASVDGVQAIRRNLQPGEQERFNVRRGLVLIAGNAGALVVRLNGEAARPLGGPGDVVSVRIGPENFRKFLVAP